MNYRIMTDEEVLREAERSASFDTNPLFAEVVARLGRKLDKYPYAMGSSDTLGDHRGNTGERLALLITDVRT